MASHGCPQIFGIIEINFYEFNLEWIILGVLYILLLLLHRIGSYDTKLGFDNGNDQDPV
jgi:hypothetical protein